MAEEGPIFHIEWRPKAREDLRGIVRFIGEDNPARAATFGQELQDKVLPLAQFPEIGRQARPGLPTFSRELVVHRHYIVLYRVLKASRTVEILRVKHTSLQWP